MMMTGMFVTESSSPSGKSRWRVKAHWSACVYFIFFQRKPKSCAIIKRPLFPLFQIPSPSSPLAMFMTSIFMLIFSPWCSPFDYSFWSYRPSWLDGSAAARELRTFVVVSWSRRPCWSNPGPHNRSRINFRLRLKLTLPVMLWPISHHRHGIN